MARASPAATSRAGLLRHPHRQPPSPRDSLFPLAPLVTRVTRTGYRTGGTGMKVMDPQGRTVRVHRRWLPWRRRVRDIESLDAGGIDGPSGDDPISLALALLGVLLLIPFVLG